MLQKKSKGLSKSCTFVVTLQSRHAHFLITPIASLQQLESLCAIPQTLRTYKNICLAGTK